RHLPRVELAPFAPHRHQHHQRELAGVGEGENVHAVADAARLHEQRSLVAAEPRAAEQRDSLLLGGERDRAHLRILEAALDQPLVSGIGDEGDLADAGLRQRVVDVVLPGLHSLSSQPRTCRRGYTTGNAISMPIATCEQCLAMQPPDSPPHFPVSMPALRISLYYTAMFGMVGVYMPFMPVWLKSRGLEPAEIGILLSCMMWIRVISNPFATQLADRLGERRRMMLVLAALATGIAACLSLTWSFWSILFVALLYTAVHAPLMPLG